MSRIISLLFMMSVLVACQSDIQPADTVKDLDVWSLEDDETLVFGLKGGRQILKNLYPEVIPTLFVINDTIRYNQVLYCFYRDLPHNVRTSLPEVDFSRNTVLAGGFISGNLEYIEKNVRQDGDTLVFGLEVKRTHVGPASPLHYFFSVVIPKTDSTHVKIETPIIWPD